MNGMEGNALVALLHSLGTLNDINLKKAGDKIEINVGR